MACSPDDGGPVLAYEQEESLILDATKSQPMELLVEESGTLVGLAGTIASAEHADFDVLHLTGHATIQRDTPALLFETDSGAGHLATAYDIADSLRGSWPRIVFLSGCKTGSVDAIGTLPSLCEALVKAGAPTVIGWAARVRDDHASIAAAELHHHLAVGKRIDETVARVRQKFFEAGADAWSLLQVYSVETQLGAVMTNPNRAAF